MTNKKNFYPSAKVICDSITPFEERLTTFEIEFHRFVLAEFNTHRTVSRNFQSSRAVPVQRLIELALTQPALPLHFGKNQPGMQAEEEGSALVEWPWNTGDEDDGQELITVETAWRRAAETAAEIALSLHKAGYHKQIVNRIIEPYLPVRGVVTATEAAWQHFFSLRCHKAAQPEIQALANEMRKAMDISKPTYLNWGDWHLPYINPEDHAALTLEQKIKVSISCCAQVSYRKLDDSLEKALDIYKKLNLPEDGKYPKDPPHFSPAEPIAKVTRQFNWKNCSGNFHARSLFQYRKALEQGIEKLLLADNIK